MFKAHLWSEDINLETVYLKSLSSSLPSHEAKSPFKFQLFRQNKLDLLSNLLIPGDEYFLCKFIEHKFSAYPELQQFFLGYCKSNTSFNISKDKYELKILKSCFIEVLEENNFLPLKEDWILNPLIHVREAVPGD